MASPHAQQAGVHILPLRAWTLHVPVPTRRLLTLLAVGGAVTALVAGLLVATSDVLAAPVANGAYRGATIASWIGVGLLTWRLRPANHFGALLVLAGFSFALTSLMALADPALFTLGRIAWAVFAVVLAYVLLSFPYGRLPGGAAVVVFRAFVVATAGLWVVLLLGAPELPAGSVLTRCSGACPQNPFQAAELGSTLADVASRSATFLTSAMLVSVAVLLARRARTLHGRERATLLAPLGCLLVFALTISASVALRSTSGDDPPALVIGWMGMAAALAMPYALVLGQVQGRLFTRAARLAMANAALEAELRASAAELHASRARIFAAGAEERRRIERDLHDSAQNRLVALRVKLGLAAESAAEGDQGLSRVLTDLGEEAQEALDAVRSIAQGVYPQVLATRGLGEALALEADGAALPVRVLGGGELPRSTQDAEAALYFCCLEAIQNACKHAASDAHVTVRLSHACDTIAFAVEDDGPGFDVAAVARRRTPGVGLTNMHDRIAAVGGTVEVVSAHGRGTVVSGSAPWRERPDGPSR